MRIEEKKIYLPDVVGKGYKRFWNFRGRYRVVKGSRASKKSKTTALNIIARMMQYPESNTLVIRQVYATLKNSCFTELKWAIHRLCVDEWWSIKESPLEMTYNPTGQKIYFRGMDNPLKVTSITVEVGYLCWCWLEEAYEIQTEDDFNLLDESIRGAIPPETGLFKQITITFNPWSEHHWLKSRFFDKPNVNTLAMTTNYMCNEWLDDADRIIFAEMKVNNPSRYQVAGLGEWGMDGCRYFSEWEERIHIIKPFEIPDTWRRYFTMDYGLDMLAGYWIAVDEGGNAYVYREIYRSGLIISEAALEIRKLDDDGICAYLAPPDLWNRRQDTGKSAAQIFAENGIPLIKAQNNRIQGWLDMHEWLKPRIDEFGERKPRLRIFSNCVNLIRTIPSLQFDDKNPNDVAREPHEITHAPDAIRYFVAGRPCAAARQIERDEDYIDYDTEVNDFLEFGV